MPTAPGAIETRKVEPAAIELLPRRPDPRVVEAIMRKSLAEARTRLERALPWRASKDCAHAVVARD
jgi:hypothetical protein